MADEFCEEYSSSLKELTFNSKPHISMLTMLAEENSQFAPQIVKCIEAHLQKVRSEAKLPTLYLIDSIVKNVSQVYRGLFTQNLVSNFCAVFEKVDEKVRAQMYKLRQTWSGIFPNKKLYAIDVRVKELDPAWPILAQPPQQTSIHINPKFLKTPAEDASMQAFQDLDGEVVKQKLLAKQQEMIRLKREQLELELLQAQAVVEEQKRQILMQEQKLRSQQQQVDLQNKLALHQLNNVGVALAAVANQGLQLDPSKAMQLKVDGVANSKDNNRIQNQPVATCGTSVNTATAAAAANAKSSVNVSQTVISSIMSVANKTNDINSLIMQGSNKSVAIKNQPQILSNSLQAPSHLYMSQLKSVVQQPIVGKNSLETVVQKNTSSVDPFAEGKSERVGLKTGPKIRSDKSEKDKGSSSKNKSPIGKKRSVSKMSKDDEIPKSKTVGDGFKSSSSSRDFSSSSSKGNARSKSSSVSPSKSRGSGKSKQWSPTSARRAVNPSRSRSPNRREKARDRDDRNSKRDRRSPRRDKENDRLNKNSSSKDSTKQDDEPPYKKAKSSDTELDQIFSGKDQDYRQLDHPCKLSPAHSNEFQGWAQYKASRPEQFKSRSRDSTDHRETPYAFGKQDLDLRTNSNLPVNTKLPAPWLPYRGPKLGQTKDGRPFERTGGPAVHPRMDPRLLAQGAGNCYQTIRENDPSIPRALMFDKGPEILRQADSQLRAGQITPEDHREIMEQLAKLFELQRMRHMQKEQQMRESIMSQRSEIGQHQEVIASSPEGSPRSEPEIKQPESSKPVLSNSTSEPTKDSQEEKQVPDVSVKTEPDAGAAVEEMKKETKPVTLDEEVSIVAEGKREKETLAIEVVISDDDEVDDKDKKRNEVKRKSNSNVDPLPRHHSRGSHRPMPTNTVMIDDQPREVRFFGNVAVVVLENNDPREIAFRGPPQDVMIGKQVLRLGFGNEKKEFEYENEKHTIQFGAPTRELYVDDVAYCAVFGGPPISVQLGGKMCEVRLCGPTPEVFFGDKPRSDILSQIMALEEERRNYQPKQSAHMQNIFKPGHADRPSSPSTRWSAPNPPSSRDYDSREWRPSNRDEPFPRGGGRDDWLPRGSGRFDEPYRSERGGLYRDDPRGPSLPPRGGPDVWPRRDDPRGNYRGPMPPMRGDMMPEPGGRHGNAALNDYYDDDRNGPRSRPPGSGFYMDSRYGPPLPPQMRRHPMPGGIPSRFEEPGMPMRAMGPHGMGGPPHQMGPMPPSAMKYRPQYMNYPRPGLHDRYNGPPHPDYSYAPNQPMPVNYNPPPPAPAPPINVSELFEKLVSTGIIHMTASQTAEPDKSEEAEKKAPDEKIPPIELTTESLKIRRSAVNNLLYAGLQCSSCGVRFTAEQADKYATHLDWHFRQNRREKDSSRKALSRKWYYDVQNWVQFEEIEDVEERARSFFEIQQADEQADEVEDNGPSVLAGEDEEDKKCAVCQELFELYWDEEHEEWHFRDAIRRNDKNYHPTCFEDFEETTFDDTNISSDEKMDVDSSAPVQNDDEIKNEPPPSEVKVPEEILEVREELMEVDTPSEVLDQQPMAEQQSEPVAKEDEEPMTTDKAEAEEPPSDGGFFGVFNVLKTDYTVPPLLLWDKEEAPANPLLETKVESGNEIKESVAESTDKEVPCNLESETIEFNEEKATGDSEVTDPSEEEVPNDDEAVDLNAVELEVEPDALVSISQPSIDTGSETLANVSASLTDSESRISDNENENIVNSDQLSKSVLGDVIEEDASVTHKIFNQSVDDENSCDNTNVKSIVQSEYVSSDENVAQMVVESETAIPSLIIGSSSSSNTKNNNGVVADDDVVLKESSDVVSDFSFETSALGTLEEDDLPSDIVSSDPLVTKDDEESYADDAVNMGDDDKIGSDVQFIVQPTVSKGVETSGLCSIM
ncbi:hypothetical protein CHUAL_011877 [Chamberlinius hualienensis]